MDKVLIKLKESGFDKFIRITNNITSAHETIRSHVRTRADFDSMAQVRETIETMRPGVLWRIDIVGAIGGAALFPSLPVDAAAELAV